MADYRIFPATNGPSSPASDTTSYTMGVEFYVTADANLTGFWWWCAPGADTSVKTHQCWQVATGTTGTAVPGTQVNTGTLTQGQWNFTALSPPVPLTPNQRYRASITDLSSGHNWYSATPDGYPADVVDGPLTAPSTVNATGGIQVGYVISSTPTYPELTTGANYWVDVQVSDPGQDAVAHAGLASGTGTAYAARAAIVVTAGAADGSGAAYGVSSPVPAPPYQTLVGGREPGTSLSGREPFGPA